MRNESFVRDKPLLQLKVSDIKQYLYCPRIIYFTYVIPVERRVTYKMQEGKEQQLILEGLEGRRTLRRYRLEEGTRQKRCRIFSENLGLEGTVDMLIDSPAGLFPVEFKNTHGLPALNHKYQLVAYALLLEESFRRPVRAGFLYLIPGNRIYTYLITDPMREYTKKLLAAMRRLVNKAVFPPATPSRGKCRDCEFRNYCNDLD
ncbi:MAG: CRISPR-associated protein Cas4 [Firmicutes bacterium]|nr:CRISPR-associated protein Cas4 [Bacillota bacterium]